MAKPAADFEFEVKSPNSSAFRFGCAKAMVVQSEREKAYHMSLPTLMFVRDSNHGILKLQLA